MFRKISFAAIAALALTAAAVAPASAGGGHGGHGGGHGMHGGGFGHGHGGYWGHRHSRFFGSSFHVGGSCYRTVFSEFGPRRINVCARVL